MCSSDLPKAVRAAKRSRGGDGRAAAGPGRGTRPALAARDGSDDEPAAEDGGIAGRALTDAGDTAAAPPPAPLPPSGYSVLSAGTAVVGSPSPVRVLYWWPSEGWQRGVVARVRRTGGFSHVVRYRRPTSALHGEVATLLDASSYGSRWLRLVRGDGPLSLERGLP